MLVIGGGAAGLTAAGFAASLGARTALVEARRTGGDCTWFGCVPSKTLLHGAAAGIPFPAAMDEVRRIRQQVYEEADAPPVLEKFGVEVIQASARFLDPHTIELHPGGRRIRSRYFVIAAGSVPSVPPLDGLGRVPYLTNETIFELTELPRRLLVLGAGPVGIEMAQAFSMLGSQVTVVGSSSRILPRDDSELALILQETLASQGIRFVLNAHATRLEQNGSIRLTTGESFEADALLLATGRRSNVDLLDLAQAGVRTGRDGIVVDHHCRTSVKHIYASGDVTGLFRFTHMAEHMSKVAVTNALLHYPMSIDRDGITWCTFTNPEFAHVGRTDAELRASSTAFEVYRFPYSRLDRSITDQSTTGMVKVFARRWDGRVYGATILGVRAGDLIAEYALAIRHGISLRKIADTIHPYPSYALANRRAADQWYVRKQSRTFVRWLQRIFRYRGQLPDTSDRERIL